ncbi:MAG: hypothetical protein KF841_08090 [Phycisphaerae bacterium]|nr:hypothetical protein [Phycisphaerae bacterium]
MLMRSRSLRWILTLTVGVCGLAAAPVRAADTKDVLKLVPEDAWGYITLRSIGTIDERAGYLQQLLNLPIPPQVTPMAMMMLNIMPGEASPIDMKSPLCIVIMDVQKFGATEGMPFPDPGNAAVVLAPVSDADGLMTKLNAEEAKEGISKCMVAGNAVFAAKKDSYVILGKNKDCVTRVLKSTKGVGDGVAPARMAVMSDSDVYVSFAAGAVMTAYRDVITGFLQGMAPAMGPSAEDVKNLHKMLEQVKLIDLAANLNKDGFALRYLIEAKKDTDLEKLLNDTKVSADSLLTRLPKEKYLIAVGSSTGYSEHAEKFGNPNMFASMLASAHAEGVDEKAVKTIDTEVQKMLKNLGAMALAVSALPDGGSQGMFGLSVVIETKDAPGFIGSIRTIWDNAWRISTDEELLEAKEFFVHKADAETIGDAKVDTLSLDIKKMADKSEMDEDEMKTFESILGKEVVLRFGAMDSKYVVMTFGGGKARHDSVCKAVKAGKAGSLCEDKGIMAVSPFLPTPRSAEVYIAVDNILQVVKSISKVMGEEDQIPFDAPTLDAPLAFSQTQDKGIQRGDMFLPTKLIVAVKKMIDDSMKAAAMVEFDEDDEESDSDSDSDHDDDSGDDSDDDE